MDDEFEIEELDLTKSASALKAPSTRKTSGNDAAGSMPHGYTLNADGIYHSSSSRVAKSSKGGNEWLCTPFTVLASFRAGSGARWGRLFQVQTADGGKREVVVFEHEIEGSLARIRARLAENGLRISHDREARKSFDALLRSWMPPKISILVETPGWVSLDQRAFVLGNGACLGAVDVLPRLNDLPASPRASSAGGSLDNWKQLVAMRCAGSPLAVVALSQAFVGPLLLLCGWQGGGLHLRGPSSCGKSTIAMAANSVWGPPERMQNWRATDNALEDIARAANDTLLCLDEIGQVDARSLDNAAYMIAEGRGKLRSTPTGSVVEERAWRVAYLSTGEIGVGEKLEEGGRKVMPGQEVRLVEFSAASYAHGVFDDLHGEVDGAALSRVIKDACRQSHGTAGPAFVELILRDPDQVRARARDRAGEVLSKLEARFSMVQDATELRIMGRLAQIAAAGSEATQAGITGWADHEVLDAVMRVLEIRYENGVGETPLDVPAIVDEVRAALKNIENEIRQIGADPSDETIKPISVFRDQGSFYVPMSIWQNLLPGRDSRAVARVLATHGLMRKADGNNLMKRVPRAIDWIGRAYTLPVSILDEPLREKAES